MLLNYDQGKQLLRNTVKQLTKFAIQGIFCITVFLFTSVKFTLFHLKFLKCF